MSIETKIKTYLENLTGKSVYPNIKPEGKDDCITYNQISNKAFQTHTRNYVYRARFEFSVFGSNYGEVKSTSGSIISNLNNNKSDFYLAQFVDERDDPDLESGLKCSRLEFYVWYYE